MTEQSHAPLEYATPVPRSRRRFGFFISLLVLASLIGVGALFLTTRRYVAVGTVTLAPAITVGVAAPTAPSRVTVVQRKSQVLPGSDGTITAHIGDITGGQVLLTVDDINGQQLVPTTSMREGDVLHFTVGTATFDIELVELKNFLTGDDFAVFEVRAAGTALSEDEKVKRLIDAVANEPGVTFIRNGEANGGAEAAAHLNRKYQSAGKGLTARDFIDEIASRSSVTGHEYRVKLPDGTEQSAAQWLSSRLREIEAKTPSTQPGER